MRSGGRVSDLGETAEGAGERGTDLGGGHERCEEVLGGFREARFGGEEKREKKGERGREEKQH
jgi:hypothetical protein